MKTTTKKAWAVQTPDRNTLINSIRTTKEEVYNEWKTWGLKRSEIVRVTISYSLPTNRKTK